MALSKEAHDKIILAIDIMLSYGMSDESIQTVLELVALPVLEEVRIRLAQQVNR